jgi:hypothetical protein|tara:strand:+ start:469 stop:708 length:240 start_codon:yes stop_codon:yes gene_type:complete
MSGLKGTLSRVATIGGRVGINSNVRAKQVVIGAATANLSSNTLSELSDVTTGESDEGLLQYDSATDKWSASNTLDGGTF